MERLISKEELAKLLHVSTKTIEREIARGAIPCAYIGKLPRFDFEEVKKAYMERGNNNGLDKNKSTTCT